MIFGVYVTPNMYRAIVQKICILIIQIMYDFFFCLILIYIFMLCFGGYEELFYIFTATFLNYTISIHMKYIFFMKKKTH